MARKSNGTASAPRTYSALVPLVLVLALVGGRGAAAQGIPTPIANPFADAMSELASRKASVLSSSGKLALEGAIDESAYVVGPGDMFSVSRGGALAVSTPIQVSAEGNLVVPEVGSISVAGLSLAEAKTKALDRIKRSYVNESVDVSLQEPRSFYVHITGAVPQPGRFISSPVSRVDDVLQESYARKAYDYNIAISGRSPDDKELLQQLVPLSSAERPALADGYRPSLRTIEVVRRDGTRIGVDLMKYYATGDTDLNPYLQDGDIIRVGAYRQEFETVRVSGPVPYPGYYAFRDGDTLNDLLAIAHGSDQFTLATDVRLISRAVSGSDATLLTIDEIRAGAGATTMLARGDHIMVLADESATAGVFGWVRYPGTYPIASGTTTLKRLVADAGGVKDDANTSLAYVERRAPTFLKSNPGVSDLDFFGRVNFRAASGTRRLLIDVADALGASADYVIEAGDVVVFPREETTVYVVGNVPTGGYMKYREGWNASDYISAAGGMAGLSRDVYVFASVSGVSYKGLNQPVRPGDTVFVDREPTTDSPELQSLLVTENTSRRQLKLASFQTVITGISAIAAVITTVVAIRR